MQPRRWMRLAAVTLLVAMTALLAAPASFAAPVPSQTTTGAQAPSTPQDLAAERELVKATLMGFGLSADQAQARVDLLTDQEVHALAADLDAVRAGAAQTFTTEEVLLVLIVIAILLIAAD